MSARITLHCDRLWQYGGCTGQLMTDALSIEEARTVAEQRGWRAGRSGDFCPTCSGRPDAAVLAVVHLHPEGSR
ncbi:hypothetical protein CWI85_25980 [Streptomyces albidoflavus]|nr:hypothetical protein CWI85_25980 [Streptomyces albidoflavus]